jgi:hypothetical protein
MLIKTAQRKPVGAKCKYGIDLKISRLDTS